MVDGSACVYAKRAIELKTPLQSCNSTNTHTHTHAHSQALITMRALAYFLCTRTQHGMDGKHCGVCLCAIMLYCFACTGIWKFRRQIVQIWFQVCVCEWVRVGTCAMSDGIVLAWHSSTHAHIPIKRNHSPLCVLPLVASAVVASAVVAAFIFIFNLFCVDLLKMFCTKACATGKASGFAANYKDFVPTMTKSNVQRVRVCVCFILRAFRGWLLMWVRSTNM